MSQWPAKYGMHTCLQAAQPKQLECHANRSKSFRYQLLRSQIMRQIAVCEICCNALVGCMQGVQQYAFFFKSIADAHNLRQRVCECFERAALPTITDQVCQAM